MAPPSSFAAQAAPILALLGETLRHLSADWRDLPPQDDLSRQATAVRLDAFHHLEALYRRELFEEIRAAAAQRRDDFDAAGIENRVREVDPIRSATLSDEIAPTAARQQQNGELR